MAEVVESEGSEAGALQSNSIAPAKRRAIDSEEVMALVRAAGSEQDAAIFPDGGFTGRPQTCCAWRMTPPFTTRSLFFVRLDRPMSKLRHRRSRRA